MQIIIRAKGSKRPIIYTSSLFVRWQQPEGVPHSLPERACPPAPPACHRVPANKHKSCDACLSHTCNVNGGESLSRVVGGKQDEAGEVLSGAIEGVGCRNIQKVFTGK